MRPSEYLNRNVRVTAYSFEPIDRYFERFPDLADVYCFSTDYPHTEGGKDSKRVVHAKITRLGDDNRREVLRHQTGSGSSRTDRPVARHSSPGGERQRRTDPRRTAAIRAAIRGDPRGDPRRSAQRSTRRLAPRRIGFARGYRATLQLHITAAAKIDVKLHTTRCGKGPQINKPSARLTIARALAPARRRSLRAGPRRRPGHAKASCCWPARAGPVYVKSWYCPGDTEASRCGPASSM